MYEVPDSLSTCLDPNRLRASRSHFAVFTPGVSASLSCLRALSVVSLDVPLETCLYGYACTDRFTQVHAEYSCVWICVSGLPSTSECCFSFFEENSVSLFLSLFLIFNWNLYFEGEGVDKRPETIRESIDDLQDRLLKQYRLRETLAADLEEDQAQQQNRQKEEETQKV